MAATAASPPLPGTGVDPSVKTAIEWSTRRAALASRGVPETDPRMTEATAALAYHRIRRAVESEVGALSPDHVDLLAAAMRRAAGVTR